LLCARYFGAGQTSFWQVRDFFSTYSNGKTIHKNLGQSPENQALIQALIGIAASFEMFSVPENLEATADARLLAELGIDYLQGYHFGAPSLTPLWRQIS
jgi:EAL domain-containing protein (putative c-di-GMP-specific phosphodiesterase class I)